MYLGITLLYYDLKSGFARKKTFVNRMSGTISLLEKDFKRFGVREDMEYIGLYDIFQVGGMPKNGQYMGRHTWYKNNTIRKANSLLKKIKEQKRIIKTDSLAELLYFYEDGKDSFSLSVLTILDSSYSNQKQISDFANSILLKKKIKKNSLDIENMGNLVYIGLIKINPIKSRWNKRILLEDDFAKINRKQVVKLKMTPSEIRKKIKAIGS